MSVRDDDLSSLLGSASLVFLAALVGSFASLLERIVAGRILAPVDYGEYSIALAVFTLASTLGAAGLTQGVPRFMSRFDAGREKRGVWLSGLGLSVFASTLVATVLIVSSPILVPYLFETDEAILLFQIFALTVPLFVVFKIGVSAIRGTENTVYKVLAEDLGYKTTRVGLIALLLWWGVGVVGTAVGYFLTLLVVIVLTYALLNRLVPLRGAYTLHIREMTTFSIPLVLSTVISVLLTRTDTVMLGYFRTSNEVGIYNAAYPLATILTVILGVFGYMYLPMASRLDSDGGGSVERLYEVTTKWIFLLIFPIFLTLLAFPNEIISIFFGREYAEGSVALSILVVGFFTNAAVGRNRETLSALGATTFILVSNLLAFVLNLALNLLLIPPYGHVGAAVASACSYIGLNVAIYLFLRRLFGISPFNATTVRLYAVLPLALGPPALIMNRSLQGTPPIIGLFALCTAILTVALVVATGGLEPEDAVLVDFIEERTGLHVPYVRRFIPQ